MEEEMEPITQLMMMMKKRKKKKNNSNKQHVCKFCNKCFPCGRSLGGHMRSHLIVLNSTIKTTISTSKTTGSTPIGEANNRNQQFDKPNEKSEEKDGDALLGSKKWFFCKECGRAFLSSKALFGHMKTHSENEEKPSSSSNNHHHVSTSLLVVPSPVHDSWTTPISNHNNQKQVGLVNNHSQSDNEAAAAVSILRPKRSIRRPRFIGGGVTAAAAATTASSSSLSPASDAMAYNNNNNNIDVAASSPVSDIEQEEQEEEVALSLIMLSKDLSQWGRRAHPTLFNSSSAHGSSDRSPAFLEDQPSAARTDDQKKSRKKKRTQAASVCAAGDEDFMKKVRRNRFRANGKKKMQAEKSSGCSLKNNFNVSMVEGIEDKANDIIRSNDGDDNGISTDGGEEAAIPLRKNLSCTSLVTDHKFDHYYYGGSKRKLLDDDDDDDDADQLETRTTASVLVHDHFHDMNVLKQQVETDKRSKFECTTCNKVFYSYQALGGHRASHNKIKGSCSSTIGTSPKPYTDTKGNNPETGIEISPPPPPPAPAAASSSNAERPGIHDALLKKKVIQKHECPICFKVFPSGQALGGHKRSHVIAGRRSTNYSESNSKSLSVHVIQKQPSPRIRDFLDLNLPPAPAIEEEEEEEETTSHHGVVGFKSWWAALEPAARGACGGNLQLIINGQEKS